MNSTDFRAMTLAAVISTLGGGALVLGAVALQQHSEAQETQQAQAEAQQTVALADVTQKASELCVTRVDAEVRDYSAAPVLNALDYSISVAVGSLATETQVHDAMVSGLSRAAQNACGTTVPTNASVVELDALAIDLREDLGPETPDA